jgi:hypothetical protein
MNKNMINNCLYSNIMTRWALADINEVNDTGNIPAKSAITKNTVLFLLNDTIL